MITTNDLRKKWLKFWEDRGHTVISSASVLPDNDPTALFHNSGMHPLVPYLSGQAHPEGKRLTNTQKCIRTGDIDEVGDATHLTFFEMLGNWSLGDYFKTEQIQWSYEFLTQELGISIEKLAVSVFAGDDDAARDEEAAALWEKAGMPASKIAFLPKSENWWAKGDTGPCGTDTEMFYWTGDESEIPESFQDSWEDPRWVEIWNDVFMQFNREDDGSLSDLPQKNIDTGMGLERTVAVLNGKKSVYETDTFTDILEKIADISGVSIVENPTEDSDSANSVRIIADHARTSSILIADGVTPSNTDQGYILRRLIRRAVRHGRKLGIEGVFMGSIAEIVIEKLHGQYPELQKSAEKILEELKAEEEQFRKTLTSGEREFTKIAEKIDTNTLSGKEAFNLYETYGFPLEMTIEMAEEKGLAVDVEGFKHAEEAHKAKSRAGAAQKFSGGLADDSVETTRLHTATHLLHAALKKFLGDDVNQKGSNITPDRLRFDFNYPEKLTPEQVADIETYVNEAIAADTAITHCETTVDQAKAEGAIGLFGDKYGDTVSMYTMGEFSKEICGGPHAARTGELGTFKIKKQESCGKGIRRIKAVLVN